MSDSSPSSKLRVFTRPTGLHSPAMVRVANALERFAPSTVEIGGSPSANYCDLQILHVIGADAIEYAQSLRERGMKYAVIQYCLQTAGGEIGDWAEMWSNADLVWSYYDIGEFAAGVFFMYAPLGVDDVFRSSTLATRKSQPPLVLTTGTVHGPGAEAILEVWQAAHIAGIQALHIGPERIEGFNAADYPSTWRARQNVSDEELAALYASATWVSGLRHVEGFELPAAEGVCCGARPILFDQPSQHQWYDSLAEFVSDRSGEPLVRDLVDVFENSNPRLSQRDIDYARTWFDWEPIASGFWQGAID